jgi:hypothetical protein
MQRWTVAPGKPTNLAGAMREKQSREVPSSSSIWLPLSDKGSHATGGFRSESVEEREDRVWRLVSPGPSTDRGGPFDRLNAAADRLSIPQMPRADRLKSLRGGAGAAGA